ncbi:hypothetical protein NM208_g2183 [Fusarium decemcellulare]|uniref:Uncharacterized protein n=1 Tax=Fusarium decemcellulare TaxID=57161 RepID=A0ACC1STU8_9HYPO|nr:hypothetical protein NM208_g2183 [Fusarium decemcellulare]
MAPSIAIIAASTRKVRVGKNVAETVQKIIQDNGELSGTNLAFIDLADFNLPVFDEETIPANVPERGQFVHEHSKKWSAAIGEHDGYIFVSPEYNYGTPGGVKNAIDYLMNEWKGKPLAVVTYGMQGGTFASDQLKHSLSMMGLNVVETRPQLPFHGGLGPDAFAAIGEGKLGDATKKDWETDHKDSIIKAFDEVKVLLAAKA